MTETTTTRLDIGDAIAVVDAATLSGVNAPDFVDAVSLLRDHAQATLDIAATRPPGIPATLRDNVIVDFFEDHAYSATTEDGQRVRKTAGGLFIPDTARGLAKKVRVIAVGPGAWSKDGKRRLPMELRVGDVGVAYKRSEYKRIPPQAEHGDTYGRRELCIVPESEVLALL